MRQREGKWRGKVEREGEKNCKKKIKRQQVGKGRQERETEV